MDGKLLLRPGTGFGHFGILHALCLAEKSESMKQGNKQQLMRKALLTLTQTAALLSLVSTAGADQFVSNLDQSTSGSSLMPSPEQSILQRFTTGPASVQVQSITIEQWFYDPANPSAAFVELYRSGNSTPLGALPNFATNSTATSLTNYTTFIDYSPDAPIDLAPNTEYILVFSEPPLPFLAADMAFTEFTEFSSMPGWDLGETSSLFFSVYEFPEANRLKVQINGVPSTSNGVPPDITGAHASLSLLWPPNGKMVPLTIEGVTDADPSSVTITITGIQQNEPIPNSAGDTSPDSLIGANGSFQLKAERLSEGNGRVYAISFLASNGTPGGEATGTVYVTVPHNTPEKSTVAGSHSKNK